MDAAHDRRQEWQLGNRQGYESKESLFVRVSFNNDKSYKMRSRIFIRVCARRSAAHDRR